VEDSPTAVGGFVAFEQAAAEEPVQYECGAAFDVVEKVG
jgi:hypothetical protein